MENSFSFIFKDFSCICHSASQTRKLAGWQWLFQTASECFSSPLRMKDRYLSLELGGTARTRFPPFLQSRRRWPGCRTPQLTMHRATAVTHPQREQAGAFRTRRDEARDRQVKEALPLPGISPSVCSILNLFSVSHFHLQPVLPKAHDFTRIYFHTWSPTRMWSGVILSGVSNCAYYFSERSF